MLEKELKIVRSITLKERLSKFYKTQTLWELLLLVKSLQDTEDVGIWSYIELLQTRTESHMTIYQFIKDRIADGSFVVVESGKKSRKVVKLSKELDDELTEHLRRRHPE
jgi:hypothetical protein